jgi:hypothetical protein
MCSDLVEEVEYDDAQIADGHSVHDPCRYSAADRQFRPECSSELARPRVSPKRALGCPRCRYWVRLEPKGTRALVGSLAPQPCSSYRTVGKCHGSRDSEAQPGVRGDLLRRRYPNNSATHGKPLQSFWFIILESSGENFDTGQSLPKLWLGISIGELGSERRDVWRLERGF